MAIGANNVRSSERFIATQSIQGSFGSARITILDVADQGAQITHTQPIGLGALGRLRFSCGDINVGVQGVVVWSRLSTPADGGGAAYRSGIRVESDIPQFSSVVESLVRDGVVKRDTESMARKKLREEERERARTERAAVRIVTTSAPVPTDQLLLIQHARERLKANPEEAVKWYNRARYTASELTAYENIPHREEVFAIWEYLERSIDVSTILRVFEMAKK